MDPEETETEETDVAPALAGAAVYQGLPSVLDPLLRTAPLGLAELAATGRPLSAEYGTPLRQLAEFSRDEIRTIQRFARESGVKVPIMRGAIDQTGYYVQEAPAFVKRVVGLLSPKVLTELPPEHIGLARASVPQALHEIGHATPILGNPEFSRAARWAGNVMGQTSPIGNALRILLASSILAPPGEDASGTRQFFYDYAPELVGATMVPQLIEEGRASAHALAGARRQGYGALRAARELVPNYGTYLAGAAAPVLATLIAKRVVKALRKRKEGEEKTSAAKPGTEVKAPGLLRVGASSAWYGGGAPKPKSVNPTTKEDAPAKAPAPAKPPSKQAFYHDMLSSLYNPGRGFRLANPG